MTSPDRVAGDPQDRDLAAGFGRRLEPGVRPALLLVDMINAYFTDGSDLDLGDDACVRSATRLLDVARSAGVPVVHTRTVYGPGGLDGGLFFRKVGGLSLLVGDTEMGRTVAQLAARPEELVVVKQYASAFFGTSLASTLTSMGVDTLVIGGVSTSGCVRATAVDSCQHGFVPLVVRDAVADRHPGVHDASLYDLAAKYAEVVDEAEATAYLAAPAQSR